MAIELRASRIMVLGVIMEWRINGGVTLGCTVTDEVGH